MSAPTAASAGRLRSSCSRSSRCCSRWRSRQRSCSRSATPSVLAGNAAEAAALALAGGGDPHAARARSAAGLVADQGSSVGAGRRRSTCACVRPRCSARSAGRLEVSAQRGRGGAVTAAPRTAPARAPSARAACAAAVRSGSLRRPPVPRLPRERRGGRRVVLPRAGRPGAGRRGRRADRAAAGRLRVRARAWLRRHGRRSGARRRARRARPAVAPRPCSARLGRAGFRSPRMPPRGSPVCSRTCREPLRARSGGCAWSAARDPLRLVRTPPRHHAPLVIDAGSDALGGAPASLADRTVIVTDRGRRAGLVAGRRGLHRAGGRRSRSSCSTGRRTTSPGCSPCRTRRSGARLALGGREARGELGRAIAELADLLEEEP